MPVSAAPESDLWRFARYFLRLGATGFGGPVALVGRMHDELVVQREWISEQTYRDGLALAQLAPGPLAAQLAIYIGWASAGIRGATAVGLAFIAPSLLMVLVLATLYVRFDGMPWIARVFYGVGAAVIAIVARSVVRLSLKSLARDRWLWSIFAVNMAVTAVTSREALLIIFLSGLLMIARHERTRRIRSVHATTASLFAFVPFTVATPSMSLELAAFFAKASLVVFGSGLAVIPFLYGGVVVDHAWLTEQQFLDAVAVSMITPGPVVITVAFMGYIIDGAYGGLAAAVGMFLPTYAAVVVLAPFFVRIRNNEKVRHFIDGVTAAATGAIAGSVVILGQRALVDATAIAIAFLALLLLSFHRTPEPAVIIAAGFAGLMLR